MPIYEYICDDCSEHYERIVMNQNTPITCPKCSSAKHTIQLSVFAAPANGASPRLRDSPEAAAAAVAAAVVAAAIRILAGLRLTPLVRLKTTTPPTPAL